MHALEEMGLIEFIAKIVEDLIDKVDGETSQLAVAVTLIVWVSAIISAFIDNIPFTTTMVPVVVRLHTGDLDLPLGPLVWALAMGACFGGNGTLIGASANVVCVRYFFSFFFSFFFLFFSFLFFSFLFFSFLAFSLFPFPFSLFPLPSSLFPLPSSLFPLPFSIFSNSLTLPPSSLEWLNKKESISLSQNFSKLVSQ